jgi:hypothetical protein
MQAWLEEQPECKELMCILSAKDRGILVDRCDKRMKERGISGVTLSKKIGIGKHAVNSYPLNIAFALLNSFLSVITITYNSIDIIIDIFFHYNSIDIIIDIVTVKLISLEFCIRIAKFFPFS